VPDVLPLPETGRAVGIDVNVENLLTTSDGERVENPKFYRQAQAKLRVLQHSLQRKQQGGKNRKKALRQVQRWHEHIANQRKDFAHKLSFILVQNCDRIALEDLKVQNLVRNHRLSKCILDSGWYLFRQLITDKAANAGRDVVLVNPAYTSKTCSCCGAIFDDLKLSDRWVECGCGLSLARDHNAAVNILKRAGWDASVSANVERRWLVRCLEAARLSPQQSVTPFKF
jgi:putative transposase